MIKHPQKVFSKAEVAKAQMELLEKKYGVLPVEVNEYGYFYEGPELLKKIRKEAKKRKKKK